MNIEGCDRKRVDPGWVQSMLDACKDKDGLKHTSDCSRSNKFFPCFCVTCQQLYCKFCTQHKGIDHPHEGHLVLHVYKASRENCLHASQVSKLIDISDIHPFSINHKQVVFLSTRGCKQARCRSTNKSRYTCKNCGRKFQREKKFCSVQCKSESGENLEQKQETEGEEESAAKPQSYRKRSRKGVARVPQRLPFVFYDDD